MLYPGYVVPPFYDSLLAKLIVARRKPRRPRWRGSRARCAELHVGGVKTTAPLHRALLADPDVRAARYHTNFLETWIPAWRERLAAAAGPREEAA